MEERRRLMEFSHRDRLLLRELSENSRATVTELSTKLGYPRYTICKLLKRLEDGIGMKFTLELDSSSLGASERHLLAVKFLRKPDRKWLESTLATEKNVQFAYATEGHFDLIIYAATTSAVEYIYWETLLIEKLSEYGAKVRASDIPYFSFGYVPFDSSLLEGTKAKLDSEDKSILRLLSENSRMSYTDIAAKTGMKKGTLRYRVMNLKKSGMIKRFTIAVQKPPQQYLLAALENWSYTKEFEHKAVRDRADMMTSDEDVPLLNTFQASAPMSGSYGNFVLALFGSRKEAADRMVKKHKAIYKGESYEIKYAQVTGALKGLFPFRNLDIKTNYNTIKWE